MAERTASVTREIKASPQAVWDAITDVTRMGEFSPECHTCTWKDGATGPAAGARFEGQNKNGTFEWSTECEVTEAEAPKVFAFDGVFGDLRFSHWKYEIEPTADGCRVTESWVDGRPDEILEATAGISGVSDRVTHNTAGMEATLERLAAAVE
ncbi:MAG TPA: SRPBCC family protein [Acidimicrobiales bacterium]|nr:SRPBCC family protein [Acidimicrobiales bacterium]